MYKIEPIKVDDCVYTRHCWIEMRSRLVGWLGGC